MWSSPRQLEADRYERMEAYFATIGPYGARMMRQTASFQVCFDVGDGETGQRRWRMLNAAAPYVVAIFANSPRYNGMLGALQSVRAECWRRLDPIRTGVVRGDDPVSSYLAFALRAPDMMRTEPRWDVSGVRRLGGRRRGEPGRLASPSHHVIPRSAAARLLREMRGADSIDPSWCAAPFALLGGSRTMMPALAGALELLGDSAGSLDCAGRAGLRDPGMASAARQLVDLALAGCARLGRDFVADDDLDTARAFFDRYTLVGRSPADDVRDAAAPQAA